MPPGLDERTHFGNGISATLGTTDPQNAVSRSAQNGGRAAGSRWSAARPPFSGPSLSGGAGKRRLGLARREGAAAGCAPVDDRLGIPRAGVRRFPAQANFPGQGAAGRAFPFHKLVSRMQRFAAHAAPWRVPGVIASSTASDALPSSGVFPGPGRPRARPRGSRPQGLADLRDLSPPVLRPRKTKPHTACCKTRRCSRPHFFQAVIVPTWIFLT